MNHPPVEPATRPVRTMHDDVDPCSDDICCCEPEPRWMALSGDDLIDARLAGGHARDARDARAHKMGHGPAHASSGTDQ